MNVIEQYPFFKNDILYHGLKVYHQTGDVYTQILESIVGIAGELARGDMEAAKETSQQFRSLLYDLTDPKKREFHPPDASQLKLMMCSDWYPLEVRETIAQEAFGRSLENYMSAIETEIPGIRELDRVI